MSRDILADFPAGGPRGSRPAEEKAQQLTSQGQPATVVMDLPSDRFLVVRAES
ncbi:hypothetical protein [Streptomyces ambofaciens]